MAKINNITRKAFCNLKFTIAFTLCFLVISIPVCFATELNLTYDANGNLITGDGKYRQYNDFNQLIKIWEGNGPPSVQSLLEEYIYHPTEERILVKKIYGGFNDPEEIIFYVNDNFVRKMTDPHKVIRINDTYYAKDETGIAGEITMNGTEWSDLGTFSVARKLFHHNDHLGSTSVITNESGDLVEETFYEPFGAILEGGDFSRYDYEGKEYSSKTEDYDFHFRKYDPELLMFTQPDSLIQNLYDPQSLNRYAFERNNPWKYVDPSGQVIEWGIVIYYAVELVLAAAIFVGAVIYSKQVREESNNQDKEIPTEKAMHAAKPDTPPPEMHAVKNIKTISMPERIYQIQNAPLPPEPSPGGGGGGGGGSKPRCYTHCYSDLGCIEVCTVG